MTAAALRFIESEVADDRPAAAEFRLAPNVKPFFLFITPTLAHGPQKAQQLDGDPTDTPAGRVSMSDVNVQPPRSDVLARVAAAGFAPGTAMVTWLDDSIGAVVSKLDQLGQRENTLMMVLSDHQSRGKATCYEAARVPALVRWPAVIRPGSTIFGLAANVDLAPTFMELAGASGMAMVGLAGRSFLPQREAAKPVPASTAPTASPTAIGGGSEVDLTTFCDVRKPKNTHSPSRAKCRSAEYAPQCQWDADAKRCVPIPTTAAPSAARWATLANVVETRESIYLEAGYSRAVIRGNWKYVAVRYPPHVIKNAADRGWDPAWLSYDGVVHFHRKKGVPTLDYNAESYFPIQNYNTPDQLYNLAYDSHEQVNLAAEPPLADILGEMKALLRETMLGLVPPHPGVFGEFVTVEQSPGQVFRRPGQRRPAPGRLA